MLPSQNLDILTRLRQQTRPYHDALEQNTFNRELGAGQVSVAATAHFLRKIYGFLVPYEAQLRRQGLAFSAEWELPQRSRSPLILADLASLPEGPLPPALCPLMPPLSTRAELLGAMYVMEGSTLGGQVITRQLAQAGIPLQRYFRGYGELTGPRWKTFCRLLTQEAAHVDQEQLVTSAAQTFQLLDAWLKQP
ncbi:biliverdin-producing heme oxygenase [Hymenobacter lutimineralis]|uniref:Biliverdin-producing heme oxygenase n=1 Tax=Hymenobacter lutimineralis TaxID=2606448 RepID=A0A5D6UVT0_9BACT|nr:biliverdin-producing heme oxygenase [Hymenobacter lutimineralis]TYZ06772.1 biliverdin-producing heme oxygenase [Hymenobacter lutimineralis]